MWAGQQVQDHWIVDGAGGSWARSAQWSSRFSPPPKTLMGCWISGNGLRSSQQAADVLHPLRPARIRRQAAIDLVVKNGLSTFPITSSDMPVLVSVAVTTT
jgi:hypothetical protein